MTIIAISADKGIPKIQLDQLSQQTSLPLLDKNIQADYLLHIKTERLELQKRNIGASRKNQKPLSIFADFTGGKSQYRRLHGGGKGQNIAKAIGLNKIKEPHVLDLTAGMGADSFVLATLGCQVTMIERNPIVHALLQDALDRANLNTDNDLQNILEQITLINNDASVYLDDLLDQPLPDVIYLDPMFPQKTKSAQVKKEMQFFHDIVGSDNDSERLFLQALSKARKRIVVKRPRLAETISNKVNVDFVISGKSTRYDIYLPKKQ